MNAGGTKIKRTISDTANGGHSLITIFGIMLLALVMLVSIAGAAPFAYIPNYGSNSVSVIDTATNKVTATVPVESEPSGVAVSPDGAKLYVSINGSNTVSVIDTATKSVITTVPVGKAPTGIAITPDGKKVYVANDLDDTTSVIDTATKSVITTVPVGDYPSGVAVSPDGTKVYVTSSAYIENSAYSSNLSVIDTTTDKVIATVNVGAGSLGVAVNPAGIKAYVTNSHDDTISAIDIPSNSVTATIQVGKFPWGVTVTPDGTKVYVANSLDNTTSVIDTATNGVTTVPVGYYPCGASVSPDGKNVYITNAVDGTVSVIDTATNRVTANVTVGKLPFAWGQFIGPVNISPKPPVANFITNVSEGYAPLDIEFTDLSQNANSWDWNFGDGSTSNNQNPTHTYSLAGTYTVNLTVSNANGSASKIETITVSGGPTPAPTNDYVEIRGPVYEGQSNGNNTLQALLDANGGSLLMESINFAGFFYDFDKDVGTETLAIKEASGDNVIAKYGLVYSTTIQNVAYKYTGWNDTYPVMGLFAEKYIPIKSKPNKLAKLVTDSNDMYTLTNGDRLNFGHGYSLSVKSIDVTNNSVWLEFDKDGQYVAGEIIFANGFSNTWSYNVDNILGENDVPVMRVHVNQISQGPLVQIDGLWLIDFANAIEIHVDDEFGKLNDVSIGDNSITIANKDTFSLTKGSDQEIGQGLFLKIANDPNSLRFYAFKKYTDPGTYIIRGQLATESNPLQTWDYTNFAGFFYDLNKNVGTESLTINRDSSDKRKIKKDNMIYSTQIKNIAYKYDGTPSWGTYPVIGFFGEKYIPLKSKPNKLTKLVTDSNKMFTLTTGDRLDLGAGYTLQAKQVDVDGKKVWLEFDKDGVYIDEKVVSTDTGQDHTWECTIDTQGETDVPVLKVHVNQISQGPLVQIDGLWLIDFANAVEIHVNDEFGKFDDVSILDNGITITNKNDVTLTKDSDVDLGQGLKFKVADSDQLRYYPYTTEVIENNSNQLPVAGFTENVTSGTAPLSVQFTDNSQNANSWTWNFGDGNSSTQQNPSHIFSAAGNYTVSLTVSNGITKNSTTAVITVTSPQSGSHVGPYAYITNFGSNTTSVIDTTTNTVVATVHVGINPDGVAVSPDGTKVYVTNEGSNTISVIDTAKNTIAASVNVGNDPIGIAVSPDGSKVYVNSYEDNTTSVIDTGSNTVIANVSVGIGPTGVAVTSDGKKVYVANDGSNTISVIDTVTKVVIATVPVGINPHGVAVTSDGSKVYVTNEGNVSSISTSGNIVSVVDTVSNIVTANVSVGKAPNEVVVTSDGSKVYVTNFWSNTISVIDTANNSVTSTVPVGKFPFGIALTPDGTKVYVANMLDGTVSVIDTATNNVTATVQVGKFPFAFGKFIGPVMGGSSSGNGNGGSGGGGGSSSGGSSSGGGGGGGGGSPEPQSNVEAKELSQAIISSGKPVKFDFPQRVTPVEYVSFDAKKTTGKTTTIVEMLKGKSTLVSDLPSEEVYKNLNIWVGNGGFGDSNNIENPVVCFKVEKAWIQDKNVDKSSITLNRYSDKKWNALSTSQSGEDDKYLYFTAQTPGFSPFVITAKKTAGIEKNPQPNVNGSVQNASAGANGGQKPEEKKGTKLPGFEMVLSITCLLAVFLCRRK